MTSSLPDHLQNDLTPGAALLFRSWLIEACRINGADWSAEGLAESLATHIAASLKPHELGEAPSALQLPTIEDLSRALSPLNPHH